MPRSRIVRVLPLLSAAALLSCRSVHPVLGAGPTPNASLLGADVSYLASPALEGRATGTPGNDSARVWIASRMELLGLEPLVAATDCPGPCPPSYAQPFVARMSGAERHGLPASLSTGNVVGMIRGRDPALRNEVVVLGAHLDHLGRRTFGARDPEARDEVRNGADDNASGVAAILELARLLQKNPPKRSVAIVAFSGEEMGLLGSDYFVNRPPFPLDSVQAMLNFDMVGRLTNDKLLVYGVATAAELPAIVDSANARGTPPLQVTAIGDGFGPSDHSSFYTKGIPVLHFFTNVHEDYHKATDDAAKLNAEGEARVIDLAWRVLREVGDREERLTFKRGAAPPQTAGSRPGSGVWLGSVPDMAAGDVKGLRLSGVTPGSPAEQAGLKEGDVIVEFDGKTVTDLYTYSEALYARQPGDVVKVVVLRGAERKEFSVTLGRRGQRNG
jgi:hypothetical protein